MNLCVRDLQLAVDAPAIVIEHICSVTVFEATRHADCLVLGCCGDVHALIERESVSHLCPVHCITIESEHATAIYECDTHHAIIPA